MELHQINQVKAKKVQLEIILIFLINLGVYTFYGAKITLNSCEIVIDILHHFRKILNSTLLRIHNELFSEFIIAYESIKSRGRENEWDFSLQRK